MPPRSLYTVPGLPSGAALNPERGLFSVIVPVESTNLISNPSFETATTGYSLTNSASIARSAAQQRRGVYSLAVTPGTGNSNPSGVQYDLTTPATATTYTLSVDLLGYAGDTYRLAWMADGAAATATPLAQTQLRIGPGEAGRWHRLSISYPASASTAYDLRLERIGSASGAVFYTDGWQVEQLPYPTTYIDGDQPGLLPLQQPPAYRWNGTRHASTSTRSGQTRAGGRVFNLQEDFGLQITGYQGLGLSTPENSVSAYAHIDGGRWQDSVDPPRGFEIRGTFAGATFAELRRQRATLRAVLQKDRIVPRQPVVLHYQPVRCRATTGDAIELICLYAGGLEEDTSNTVGEQVAIRFMMPDPALRRVGEQGTTLDSSDALSTPIYALERIGGIWTAHTNSALDMSGGSGTGVLNAVLYDPNSQYLYFAGGRTTATTQGRVVRYDTITGVYTTLGGGAAFNAQVRAMCLGPDGQLYVAGSFTQNPAGSVTYNYVARWDGSAWQTMGSGVSTTNASGCASIAIDATGAVYAGRITTGAAVGVYAWDGASWNAIGPAGAGAATTHALIISQDGYLVEGRSDGDINKYVDIPAVADWSTIGAANGVVRALALGTYGEIVAAGTFSTINGLSAANIAQYTGGAWTALGSGVGSAGVSLLYAVAVDPLTGLVVTAGSFVEAGGVPVPEAIALYTGATWIGADFDLSSASAGLGLSARYDGRIALAMTASSGTTSGQATLTVLGDAQAVPVFQVTGPGTLYQIANLTTGQVLSFQNLTLLASEIVTIDLTPDGITAVSSFRGSVVGAITPGSLSQFRLLPGANLLTCFMTGSSGATAVTVRYRPTYASVDSLEAPAWP